MSEEEIFLSHSGDGRMRLTKLTSFPCRIFCLSRGEMLAAKGIYGLPSEGAGIADASEWDWGIAEVLAVGRG